MKDVRRRLLVTLVLPAVACAHDERRPAHDVEAPTVASTPPVVQAKPQYLIADPDATHPAVTVPLGPVGVFGLAVDRQRFVVGRGEPRGAADTSPAPLVGATKVPSRFGGGFLFWTSTALYRSDAFDSALVPIARVPEAIESVSFGPHALLVYSRDGQRWGLTLPGGERTHAIPVGLSDVEAVDDGRAIAWSDQGTALTSVDHGAHWTDVTAQLHAAPARVTVIGSDPWLFDANGGASRLDLDGRVVSFDHPPTAPTVELRPRDPRWHGSEPPLRAVFRSGAMLDEQTAVVVDAGNIVRVDLRTGSIVSMTAGGFAPDAECEAVPVPGDVVFACSARGGNAFVVAHTLGADAPIIEQTFGDDGHFTAGDDGGLAFAGSCQPIATTAAANRVCVRMPGGRWEELEVSHLTVDGGAPDIRVGRWVPRADGHVVALLVGAPAGIYDPRAQTLVPASGEGADDLLRSETPYTTIFGKKGRHGAGRSFWAPIVDTNWSFAGGDALRGWRPHGGSIELSADGKLTPSTYSFETAHAGALALAWSKEGQLYQSLDHGASWAEIAPPPSGADGFEVVRCSSVGCDLGAFYRVGWSARPTEETVRRSPAASAPEVGHVRGLELACRVQGGVTSKAIARTSASPEDLGLGANRLPIASERTDWSYLRNTVSREIVSPVHASGSSGSDGDPSLRAVFSGFATASDGDVLKVSGPNKNALSLRRDVAYVAPFDPIAKISRAGLAMSDVVAAGRRAGLSTDEILVNDFTESGVVIPLLSSDPSAASDIAIHNADHGLLAVVRGERSRVFIRSSSSNANVVSGALLGGPLDEAAFLELETSGVGHVFKVGTGGVSDLFEVNSGAVDTYYPANPDALAVGPKGEIVVLRTPSGRDPASAFDPAYVVAQGQPPEVLAPWSELKLGDDPACKADSSGYRAVLQLAAPWVRLTNPELRVAEAPMIARVRWTPKRVCLEAFEVEAPSVNVRVSGTGASELVAVATWLVAKGSTFARVGVGDGVEWRQALECNIVATGP
jgi:hypothetical protein